MCCVISSFSRASHASAIPPHAVGLHADRIAGGHRHHCHFDWLVGARCPKSAGGGQPLHLPEQSQTDRRRLAQLSRGLQEIAPGGIAQYNPPPTVTSSSNSGLAFQVVILPFVEQDNLSVQFDRTKDHRSAPNVNLGPMRVPIYFCPSANFPQINVAVDPSEVSATGVAHFTVHYIGNAGPKNGTVYTMDFTAGTNGGLANQGVLFRDSRVRFIDITDGTSNTFMVCEMSFDSDQNGFRSWIRGCNSDGGNPPAPEPAM